MLNKRPKHIQKKSVEYAQFRLFRMLSFLLYALFGTIVIGSAWFLYTRMYQTIGQVESLAALSPLATTESLNVKGFESVEQQLLERRHRQVPAPVRDPFTAALVYEALSAVPNSDTTSTVSGTTSTVPEANLSIEEADL